MSPTEATTSAKLSHSNSHCVKFDYSQQFDKEEVYLYYVTTWRGEPVRVTMSCDRYRHSSGISDWRVYAQDARKDVGDGVGDHLTDLARRRLSEQSEPMARGWLKSDDYRISEALAIEHAIKRVVREAYKGTDDARKLIGNAEIQRKVGASVIGALTRACDARDAYEAALEIVK